MFSEETGEQLAFKLTASGSMDMTSLHLHSNLNGYLER